MIIACICGGTIETWLLFLGLTGAIKLLHSLRKKFRKCKCCENHESHNKEENHV